jgi:uncharacterized membrane protein YgdD (TMEM256/DUF423 family)
MAVRLWIFLGCVFALIGVACGAFGAHALRDSLAPRMLEVWRTAVTYQLVHALALFAVAFVASRYETVATNIAGALLAAGILLFSGSLYLLATTGMRWLGPITPLGGLCFLAGWAVLAYAAISGNPAR